MKTIYLYSLSRHYTKLVIYHGCKKTSNIIATTVVKPIAGLDRKQRYDVLAAGLLERTGLKATPYREK